MTDAEFIAHNIADATKAFGTVSLQQTLASDDEKPLSATLSLDPFKAVPAGNTIVVRLTAQGGATEATTAATGVIKIDNYDTINADIIRVIKKDTTYSDIQFASLAAATVTVNDYTANSSKSLTITHVDASTTVLTEGTHWDSVTNNNTAAANLKAAITAATSKVTATVLNAVVTITARHTKGVAGNATALALTGGSGMALSSATLTGGANNNVLQTTSDNATALLLEAYIDGSLSASWTAATVDDLVTLTCVIDTGEDGNDDSFTITSTNSAITQSQAFTGGVDENAGFEVAHWVSVHWRKEF